MLSINIFRLPCAGAMLLALTLCGAVPVSAQTFTNYRFPGVDPSVTWDDSSGIRTYYYSESCGNQTQICVRSSTTLTGIAVAAKSVVWTAATCSPTCQPNSLGIARPEIIKLGGSWYIYYSAKPDNTAGSPRNIFVLKSDDGPVGHYYLPTTRNPGGSSSMGRSRRRLGRECVRSQCVLRRRRKAIPGLRKRYRN